MSAYQAVLWLGGQSVAARRLGVSPQAVDQWMMRGSVPPARAIRIEQLTKGKYKAQDLVKMQPVYRVRLGSDMSDIEISGFATDIIDDSLFGTHTKDSLPEWFRNKLSVLLVAEPRSEYIAGVGARITTHTFWVEPECYVST